jgi:hypothetical protein
LGSPASALFFQVIMSPTPWAEPVNLKTRKISRKVLLKPEKLQLERLQKSKKMLKKTHVFNDLMQGELMGLPHSAITGFIYTS